MQCNNNTVDIRSAKNEKIQEYLQNTLQRWDFDVFEYQELCARHDITPIAPLIAYTMQYYAKSLGIDLTKILLFAEDVISHYLSPNSVIYHNSDHAIDVTCTQYYIIKSNFSQVCTL